MTPDDVRAAAEQLVDFHEEFAPLFGMRQAQDHAFDYINGLMSCPERKSVEPIALLVGHGDVSGLQKFLNSAPWDRDDVQDEIQAVFARRLAPSASGTAVGVVGVVDESCFSKKGRGWPGQLVVRVAKPREAPARSRPGGKAGPRHWASCRCATPDNKLSGPPVTFAKA
jgi:SRSO17 transposase